MTFITEIFKIVSAVFEGMLAQLTTFITFVTDPNNAILWIGFALLIIGIAFKKVKGMTKM